MQKSKVQPPWVLDGHRLTEEAGERANNEYHPEGTEEAGANLVLADMDPAEMNAVLQYIWMHNDELWDEFVAIETQLLDIMTEMARKGEIGEIAAEGPNSHKM